MAKAKSKKVKARKAKTSKFKILMEKMKMNPRLKKQIRLTFASVFLITAIVVAAIPPGDIEAGSKWEEQQQNNNGDTRGNAVYPSTAILQDVTQFSANNFYKLPRPVSGPNAVPDLSIGSSDYVSPSPAPSPSPTVSPSPSPTVSPSPAKPTAVEIREISGQYRYISQFNYDTIRPNAPAAGSIIITEYLDPHYNRNLDLSSNFLYTEFYTVRQETFDKFYNIEGANELTTSGVKMAPGEKIYKYNYIDYPIPDTVAPGSDLAIIKKFSLGFDDIDRQFRLYKAYDDWYEGGKVGTQPPLPADSLPPLDLSVSDKWRPPAEHTWRPNDRNDIAFRYAFFCYIAENVNILPTEPINGVDVERIQGKGYTLHLVFADNVHGFNNAEPVFAAKGGNPEGTWRNNAYDFLVKRFAQGFVAGIGNEAFAGYSQVETLTLSSAFRFIGDSAFEGNLFLKSINLSNIYYIGNRAFKGCQNLETVNFFYAGSTTTSAVNSIGTEAFAYCSSLASIIFPGTVKSIGDGAFAFNHALKTVDMTRMVSADIGKYAFYDCYNMDTPKMEADDIRRFGIAAFAVANTPQGLTFNEITLPGQIGSRALPTAVLNEITANYFQSKCDDNTDAFLGNYLFEGRANLTKVVFPTMYGTNIPVTIPEGMFVRCAKLLSVEWAGLAAGSPNGSRASFGPLLFLHVESDKFIVFGPEFDSASPARPRRSTWDAFSMYRDTITYKFIRRADNIICYEIGNELENYRMQVTEDGVIVKCEKIDTTKETGKVTINPFVGTIRVKKIGSNSFLEMSDMTELYISNDSIESIDAGVFEGFESLKKVTIGNSVNSIGKDAFKGCKALEEVVFRTPSIGHYGFTIGDAAFQTTGTKLTFYGDLVDRIDKDGKEIGYAPFEYAMRSGGGLFAPGVTDRGHRILYKSLPLHERNPEDVYNLNWNPDLSVILFEGEVLLVDYPILNPYNEVSQKPLYDAYNYHVENIRLPSVITSINALPFFNGNNVNVVSYFGPGTNGLPEWVLQNNTGIFKENKVIVSIRMDGVKTLPNNTFDNCEKLKIVHLGGAITDIGTLPFRGCILLDDIVINDKAGKYDVQNGIIFTVTDPVPSFTEPITKISRDNVKSYRIEQVLPARGNDNTTLGNLKNVVAGRNEPLLLKVNEIATAAFKNCVNLVSVDLSRASADMEKKLTIIPEECFRSCDLTRISLPNSVNQIRSLAFADNKRHLTVRIPTRGALIFSDDIFADTSKDPFGLIQYAVEGYRGSVPDLMTDPSKFIPLPEGYLIEFFDPYSFTPGKPYYSTTVDFGPDSPRPDEEEGVYVAKPGHPHNDFMIPPHPAENPDYENLAPSNLVANGWNDDPFLGTNKSISYYALYKPDEFKSGTTVVRFWNDAEMTSQVGETQFIEVGKSAHDVRGITKPPANQMFVRWDTDAWKAVRESPTPIDVIAIFGPKPNEGTSSPSPSPSPGAVDDGKFTVTVSGGSGSGRYAPGATVTISAYAGTGGRVFDRWTTASTGVGLLDANSAITVFTMPGNNVSLTATYKAGLASSTGSGGAQNNESGPGSGSGSGGPGSGTSTRTNASVEITRPGIPNHELASASVSGSLDNFVIKISDNQAATDAVIAALTRHFGDLSNIVYFPMNIELFDASGLHKITDTTGLNITITMPLPTSQLPYGASNKVASAKGGILEHLSPRFSSIDGVPSVTFSTTHFSPYVIYADLDNLIPGTIDDTPKTGDGIHPKWLFVIGLVSMSMILFLKREKMPKLKTT